MEISVSQEHGRVPVTVMSIQGEINAETSDEFLAAVRQAYAGGACDLLLDLSQVTYISSWGIRALSEAYSMLRGREGQGHEAAAAPGGVSKHLKLLSPTTQVRKVLETAGLDMYLESFTDKKRAVAAF